MQHKQKVFISCGQASVEEKQLGKAVCKLVRELSPFDPYFAENQNSVEGLTTNILGALNDCIGLIVIMHPRGEVRTLRDSHVRASVWIEQEIAIAAFMQQILGKHIYVAAYQHAEIAREGMRDKIQLNPQSFKSNTEILEHLRTVLPGWAVTVPQAVQSPLNLTLGYDKVGGGQEEHLYQLKVTIENTGSTRIDNFHVDVEFLDAFLVPASVFALEVTGRRTLTHRFFRATCQHHGKPMFAGDKLIVMTIDYFMNSGLHPDQQKLAQTVKATAYADGFPPRVVEEAIRKLRKF